MRLIKSLSILPALFFLMTVAACFGQEQNPASGAATAPNAAVGALAAQAAETGTNAPAAGTASLRGHVADPTGARIPGAQITVTSSAGTAATATADATGDYVVNHLAPGDYTVQAAYAGFAPFTSPAISLAGGQAKRVDISMAVESEQQSVVVTDETPTVNTEAAGNASAIVLKDKDLEALSDDPDELASELEALAGPSAGPNGGQIYIDGFTGGQLPPKSAIREIRINQNPFSAEYDKLGYGRIEILTKPGTDKLNGRIFVQGNDDLFNTGNPFTANLPSYHSIQYNGTINGAISKNASFFFTAEQRDNQNDSVYTLTQAPVQTAANTYTVEALSGSLFSPATRTNISPRIDVQLGKNNTLTLRYQFNRNSESGQFGQAGGSTSLPTQASASTSYEHTIQLTDSEIINNQMVNETHFQYLRDSSSTTPVSTMPLITVPQAFTGGGSMGQFARDHGDRLELQNLTTWAAGRHAIKFGARLRDSRDADSTDANFNGSFTFATVADLASAMSGGAAQPSKLTYTTGPAGVRANVFDAALFIQDDFKYNAFLTLSGGLRWESQNHIADHDDWAPRVAFAYALDGHKSKKQAKTVLRGGYGLFYDRLAIASLESAERFNGSASSQQQKVITNPSPACFYAAFEAGSLSAALTPTNLCAGSASSATSTTIDRVAPGFHAPYTGQLGVSLERQVNKGLTVTATYLHSYGVHQLATIDANAYEPGTYEFGSSTLTGVRPDPSLGLVNEYFPEAVFKENQLIVNVKATLSKKLSITGYYALSAANSDTGTASNSYELMQDYGRAGFVARNMVFLTGTYSAPWGITLNPFVIAQSGKPFNIVSGLDLNGDNFFNSRPAFAADASLCTSEPAQYIATAYGCMNPDPGEAVGSYEPIPANLGGGPAAVAVNLRVSRSFGLGPKVESAGRSSSSGSQSGSYGGGYGGRGGGGRGGGMGGGLGGGLGAGGLNGGGSSRSNTTVTSSRRYSLTFSAQALNLFNDIDLGTPAGNVTAPNFGQSTSLATGVFSSGAAARRIFIQAAFSF